MRKILVCGSRSWTDEHAIESRLKTQGPPGIVMHGKARGADAIGNRVARRLGFEVQEFPADWERYGKRAGYLRNIKMLDEEPHIVMAFWDGESKGTKHTIDEARKRGIRLWVVRPFVI